MEYKLARELEDCGFLQDGNGTFGCKHGGHAIGTRHCEQDIYFPTLSELIQACGGGLFTLFNEPNYKRWAGRFTRGEENNYHSTGATPEEAVANLWLALNKK